MTNVKLSQIAPSPSNVAATTQFVAVEGGNTDYLFSPSQFINGFGLLRSTVADQTLSGGWNVTPHANASGASLALDCGQGPLQTFTNNTAGGVTISAPGSDGQTLLQITNGTTPGIVTWSGFTVGPNTGDPLNIVANNKFSVAIWRVNGISSYYIYADQASAGVTTVNVMSFGATGNGVTDDTSEIQAAINAAALLGQGANASCGIVFFPAGTYKTTAALVNNNASTTVRLIGVAGGAAGVAPSRIIGNFAGYIIDTTFTNFASGVRNNQIQSIENLALTNQYASSPAGFDCTVGCIRLQNFSSQVLIQDVQMNIKTGVGLYAWQTCFENMIIGCSVLGNATNFTTLATAPFVAGPVGFYVGGCICIACKAQALVVGMWQSSLDTTFLRCRAEECGVGLLVGGAIAGVPPTGGTAPAAGGNNSTAGNMLLSSSSEACDTAVMVLGGTSTIVDSLLLTGTVGVSKTMSNAVYNSPTAGQVLVTVSTGYNLSNFGWTSGTRKIMIESITSSNNPGGFVAAGFNTNARAVTATWQSDTTFSYTPIAGDPGTYTSGSQGFNWSFPAAYGLRVGTTSPATTFRSINCSFGLDATAGIDLYMTGTNNAGGNTGGGCTFISCQASNAGWIMPSPKTKSAFQFINCDQPAGSDVDLNRTATFPSGQTAGLVFANIPGNIAATNSGNFIPQEGQQYDIIDAPFGLTSQGATLTGILTSGTLTASSVTGLISLGDQLIASGSLGNITAGTTIRAYNTLAAGTLAATGGAGTYLTNTTQTLAGTDTGMSTRYSNFGRIITAGGSNQHCRVRCSAQPFNPMGTVSDGTNDALFYAMVGVHSFIASTSINSTNFVVVNLPTGAVLSVGDTITGSGIQASTTIAAAPGGGGVGTYTLSQNATATVALGNYVANSSVLNVLSILSGTISTGASWIVDLSTPSSQQTANRTITGAGPLPLPGSGGIGTYQLSTPLTQFQIGQAGTGGIGGTLMGAGLTGVVLTLYGTTTGSFSVGNIFIMGTQSPNIILSQGRTSGNPQWNLNGAARYEGAQPVNAALWTVCG